MVSGHNVQVTPVSIRSQVLPYFLTVLYVRSVSTKSAGVPCPIVIDVGENDAVVVASPVQAEFFARFSICDTAYSSLLEQLLIDTEPRKFHQVSCAEGTSATHSPFTSAQPKTRSSTLQRWQIV